MNGPAYVTTVRCLHEGCDYKFTPLFDPHDQAGGLRAAEKHTKTTKHATTTNTTYYPERKR